MVRNNWLYVGILVVVPMIIGLFTFRDYGQSADEGSLYTYSDYSLDAYLDAANLNFNSDLGKGNFRYYGPSFLMGANLFARILTLKINDLTKPDAWHLAYFLSFQACVIGFYFLAKHWFSNDIAFSATLLFLFQPLIWGHAFINPKDTPFMSFCLLSIVSGLIMQKKLFSTTTEWKLDYISILKRDWFQSEKADRVIILRLLSFVIVILAILKFGQQWIKTMVSSFLMLVDSSGPENIITKLFSFFAKNYQQIPIDLYVPKGVKLTNILLIAVATILLFSIFTHLRRIFANIFLNSNILSPKIFTKHVFQYLSNPYVMVAGMVLGLTISVRILGPFPGIIMLFISIYRAKMKALPAFLAYFLIAFVIAYLTWPYLWQNPISNFKTSVTYMSDFPWSGKVLFNGNYYPNDQLPIGYVPVLFGIQFTEPVVFLFIIGLFIFSYQAWKQVIKVDLAIVMILWGLIPFIAFTILRPSLYDNVRQLLFIVPPFFLIICLALEKLFNFLNKPFLRFTAIALILLTGIYPIIHLHPYQYTYYNSFINGLQGSSGQFESDYWATSFREAVEHLNHIAPRGSRLIVYGPGDADLVSNFARSDLVVDSLGGTFYDPLKDYQYAVISTRNNREQKKFTDWKTIYVIQRDGNIFAIVKQRPE